MVELARGLTPGALAALAGLEERTVAGDGGRLKLEWGTLRARTGVDVEDLVWWDGERLLGFLGLYTFDPPSVELVGMVDPAARRRGIGRALIDAALPLCRERGLSPPLLVVPRTSVAGRALALGRGATLDHSEHALVLHGPPAEGPSDRRVTVRPARPADVPELSRLLAVAFGSAPGHLAGRLDSDSERTLVVELDGVPVGTVRLTVEGGRGGVYGFAVDPARQGRGIGRDVLRRVCHQLRREGVDRIGLEVEVANDHALALYTSLGFVRVTTEDYFALPLPLHLPLHLP